MKEKKLYLFLKSKCPAAVKKTIRFFLWSPRILRQRQRGANLYEGWVFSGRDYRRLRHNNWGDELNQYLFEYATGEEFISVPYAKLPRLSRTAHYMMVGSILSFFPLDKAIIYGTGVMDDRGKLVGTPSRIISVRGPLTREVLLQNGIACPARFGDPALLLPLFYTPPHTERRRVGVVLHWQTEQEKIRPILERLNAVYDCKIISMTEYDKWTDVIDEICGCSFVLSESLHALIAAETYHIANIWVEFEEHWEGWDFKFRDFYESVQKRGAQSVRLWELSDYSSLALLAESWKRGEICYEELLKDFPFPCRKTPILQ